MNQVKYPVPSHQPAERNTVSRLVVGFVPAAPPPVTFIAAWASQANVIIGASKI